MKKKRMGVLATSLALAGTMVSPLSTFAATNEFGIVYSGGNVLSASNVQINPDLINSLAPLITYDNVTVETSDGWGEGYIKGTNNNCRRAKYLLVGANGVTGGDKYFTITAGRYSVKVTVDKIVAENFANDGKQTTFGVVTVADGSDSGPGFSAVYGGWQPYSSPQCTDESKVANTKALTAAGQASDEKIFAEFHLKLYKDGAAFSSDDLFLGIVDIDASQSYMIRSANDQFATQRLYAADPANLQPQDETRKNWFVNQEVQYSYIYSDYNPDHGGFDDKDHLKVFASISRETQETSRGLDTVFGFVSAAASRILYSIKQYTVNYVADIGGRIPAGQEFEQVISGDSPTGSKAEANSGYVFDYWTTNQDVEVADGDKTVIKKAGDKIGMDQIKSIIVHDDYTFTAHFKPKSDQSEKYVVEYKADEGGIISGITDEEVESGGNPSGSTPKADDGYAFSHWTTNQDVTLEDGTIIKAGEKIGADQITKVVVDKNMQFTAHFKKKAGSPNTGAFSGDIGAVTIATASTLVLLLVAVAIKVLPQITRRRVKFD